MKRIGKIDAARKNELVGKLTVAENKLTEIIESHNEAVKTSWKLVETAMGEYNKLVQEANGFCEDIASEIEAHMDERSDKWRESDAASVYEEWKSSWEQDLDEIELDEPEEIATSFDDSAADILRDLEDEV